MVWATRHFKMYLYGKRFKLFTDSRAAKLLVEANDTQAGGRLLRWRLALEEFDFTAYHKAGARNGNADALSRLYIRMDDPYEEGPTDTLPRTMLNTAEPWWDADAKGGHEGRPTTTRWWEQTAHLELASDPTTPHGQEEAALNAITNANGEPMEGTFFPPEDREAWYREEWRAEQEKDPLCAETMDYLKLDNPKTTARYTQSKDGLLYRFTGPPDKRDTLLVVPESLKAFLLSRYHSLPISGHKGRDKTIALMKQRYFWDTLAKDVGRWIKSCLTCQRRKQPRPLRDGQPSTVCEAKGRWETISIDLVEAGSAERTKDGCRYILTVIDIFTRYVFAIPLKSKKSEGSG